MRRVLVVVMFMLQWSGSPGQTLNDPVYLNFSFLPGRTSIPGFISEINATVPPVKLSKGATLINTIYYRNTRCTTLSPGADNLSVPGELHDLRYTLILRAKVTDRTDLVLIPRLMLRSDLRESVSGKDLFPQVVLLGTYAFRVISRSGSVSP